jgi:hypothetical protein
MGAGFHGGNSTISRYVESQVVGCGCVFETVSFGCVLSERRIGLCRSATRAARTCALDIRHFNAKGERREDAKSTESAGS